MTDRAVRGGGADPAGESAKQGYDPRGVEERWYQSWEERGLFRADVDDPSPPYSIVIPPPNVTGSLHMGHALNNTLQDILIRWHRMRGDNTLWMPGTDHAGIATQNVVERQLRAEGLTREQVGREAFVQRVWRWKAESGGTIIRQLKRLGASCDWERERFTLDPGLSDAVKEVFCQLYEAGLIYRGDYIINWCPRCRTALSDLEVEYEDRAGRLWHIRYPMVEGEGDVVVATTRPETMLGDTAVAANPEDPRYRRLIGRTVRLPLLGRAIPVVADAYVDPAFGTGLVKVTPAHDAKDFEAGLRHGLAQVKVIADDGRMTEAAGPYAGLDRYECRKRVVADLARQGLLVREEPYSHAVGHCYRCSTVVEPSLSRQWFVRMKPLAEPAIQAVEQGRVRIIPGQWEKTYFEWMRNIRDWCVSRQIWWGHRIPAWYCDPCGETIVSRTPPAGCPKCGATGLRQETDVLDTWFSSALWPFSTLGWPARTKELSVYYPTSCLVTGFDILFFWVARMIMMGLRFRGEVPFRDVVIHGLIRDEAGEKMSKTRGNVIDPLHVINGAGLDALLASATAGGAPPAALDSLRRQFPEGFPAFGADALRFTLAALAGLGSDIKLSVKRIEGYRHFCNKIWNAFRFVAPHVAEGEGRELRLSELPLSLSDRWILSRLNQVIEGVTDSLGSYRFNDAASLLYQFLWHEYCDWYLEIVKNRLGGNDEADRRVGRLLLVRVLEQSLRLLHPIMPFLTEEIWQRLLRPGMSIMRAPWPQPEAGLTDARAVESMELVMEITREVRNLRSAHNISPAVRLPLVVRTDGPARGEILEAGDILTSLARLSRLSVGPDAEKPDFAATSVVRGVELFVPLEGVIDLEEEHGRLARELDKTETALSRIGRKLSNADFLAKAPEAVVSKERAAQAELEGAREKLQEGLRRIEAYRGR
jgi:valyl-tRNA synthetase